MDHTNSAEQLGHVWVGAGCFLFVLKVLLGASLMRASPASCSRRLWIAIGVAIMLSGALKFVAPLVSPDTTMLSYLTASIDVLVLFLVVRAVLMLNRLARSGALGVDRADNRASELADLKRAYARPSYGDLDARIRAMQVMVQNLKEYQSVLTRMERREHAG